jgi:phospholipase C
MRLDFFGDGTRIPLLAISPWAKREHVDHAYSDHASVLKFIEWNWGLGPIGANSRDRLPNPVSDDDNPYVPRNGPALSDLRRLFQFDHDHHKDEDRD